MQPIPFNKPFIVGHELEYIREAVQSGHLAGDGLFTRRCHRFFEERYGMHKALLTHSCTAALEMAALLLDIKEGDEVIAPSFAFVSTANAFALRGAKMVFADSCAGHPNIDPAEVEKLIGPKTRAIVLIHYAGMACDMDFFLRLSKQYRIPLVEDAAHAIESTWKGVQQLGTIGSLGAFSFHETKNVIAGEGGLLSVNDRELIPRSEIIREKGTNRPAFFRGETDRYEWVDLGSSFLPSELTAAFLYAQLEKLGEIQEKRIANWNFYQQALAPLEKAGKISLPELPQGASNNAHIFYVVCRSPEERMRLLSGLREKDIHAVFHYQSLHRSRYFSAKHDGRELPNADRFSDCLLRLPLFWSITQDEQEYIVETINQVYR